MSEKFHICTDCAECHEDRSGGMLWGRECSAEPRRSYVTGREFLPACKDVRTGLICKKFRKKEKEKTDDRS